VYVNRVTIFALIYRRVVSDAVYQTAQLNSLPEKDIQLWFILVILHSPYLEYGSAHFPSLSGYPARWGKGYSALISQLIPAQPASEGDLAREMTVDSYSAPDVQQKAADLERIARLLSAQDIDAMLSLGCRNMILFTRHFRFYGTR